MSPDTTVETNSETSITEDTVQEMIDLALTRDDLRGLDIDEAEVKKRVLAQLNALRDKLRPELSAVQRAAPVAAAMEAALNRTVKSYAIARGIGDVLFVGWLVLLAQSLFGIDWPWPNIRWSFIPHWSSNVIALLLIAVSLGVLVGVHVTVARLIGRRRRDHDGSVERQAARNAKTNLAERGQIETEALVRAAVNDLDGPGSTMGAYLTTSEAPALVELDAVDTVPATGLRQVEDFIDRHPTSAIGVAGPRGIGKSTVLRRVSADAIDGKPRKSRVGVYVQSPVYYEASDFVRSLHQEIARSILRDLGDRYESPEVRIGARTRSLRLMIASGLAVSGLTLLLLAVVRPTVQLTAQGLLGLTLVGVSICYLMFALLRSSEARRAKWYAHEPAGLAQRELRRLTWSATTSNKETTSLKLLAAIDSSSEQQASYAERDRSHPDRVADLRNFLREFYQLTKIPIVIAIDELDKMASPEKAIEAINGLKDLFHLDHTHFVVSVSQDALASFALRGVPVRDVFDSSFDDVIRLRPFSADNSVNLLLGRTVKFPRVASLFCHAISGGLPRDLVRAARRTVQVRQHASEDLHVTKAFAKVVRKDLSEALEAAILKARERGEPELPLFDLKTAFADNPDLGLRALTERPELLRPIGGELVMFILTLITIREFFLNLLSDHHWRRLIKDAETIRLVEELSAARSLVATSPLDCLRHLNHVRAQTHLEAIPVVVSALVNGESSPQPTRTPWRLRIAALLRTVQN